MLRFPNALKMKNHRVKVSGERKRPILGPEVCSEMQGEMFWISQRRHEVGVEDLREEAEESEESRVPGG